MSIAGQVRDFEIRTGLPQSVDGRYGHFYAFSGALRVTQGFSQEARDLYGLTQMGMIIAFLSLMKDVTGCRVKRPNRVSRDCLHELEAATAFVPAGTIR